MFKDLLIAIIFRDWCNMATQEFLTLPSLSSGVLAERAGTLVRSYLYENLPEPEREDLRRALTLLTGHPLPLVRRALAEGVAYAADAPHHIVHAFANDVPDIAAIVLARSPLLTDVELVDCVATANAFAQSAIANRAQVGAPVCAALAEVGELRALLALASNPGAELPEFSLRRMIQRHGNDEDLRSALLSRPNLPIAIRCDLAIAEAVSLAARDNTAAVLMPQEAECVKRDATERAIIKTAGAIAGQAEQMAKLVVHLRNSRQLTARLLLRGLLSGNRHFFEAALCELSGLSLRRTASLAADGRSAGFAALYRRAGMPKRLFPVFAACLDTLACCPSAGSPAGRIYPQLINSLLQRCAAMNRGDFDRLIGALHRLEVEAAREEAHDFHLNLLTSGTVALVKSRDLPRAVPPISSGQARQTSGEIVIDVEAFEAALLAA